VTCDAQVIIFLHMMAMIQIRNVPDTLHRRLKSRAAVASLSLSDYLLSEIRQVAERPTVDELRARLERYPGLTPSIEPAQAVRTEHDRQEVKSQPSNLKQRDPWILSV
jgi:antitoxin FitA